MCNGMRVRKTKMHQESGAADSGCTVIKHRLSSLRESLCVRHTRCVFIYLLIGTHRKRVLIDTGAVAGGKGQFRWAQTVNFWWETGIKDAVMVVHTTWPPRFIGLATISFGS